MYPKIYRDYKSFTEAMDFYGSRMFCKSIEGIL